MQTAVDLNATLPKWQGENSQACKSTICKASMRQAGHDRLTNMAGRMDTGMEVHYMQAGAGSFPYTEAGAVGGPAGLLPLCG